ncbi:hypothetical protein ElyMa_004000900 [Elysia marginata]|uniref:Uncharacterized protein n=1 Tax=Elysia marginata TaxID=1093978 RepID=A0AAV4FZ18_9GAST|nr:hypothetical protein ElyMa_004000900 [Elysia marginata]
MDNRLYKPLLKREDVYTTRGHYVLFFRVHQASLSLTPYTHEGADTRVLHHAHDSTNKECRRITLHAVNKKVLIMALSIVVYLEDAYIWVAFSTFK